MARISNHNQQYALCGAYCLFLFLAACSPTVTPTPFIPPTDSRVQTTGATSIVFSTSTPLAQSASQSAGIQSAASSSAASVGATPSACPANCPGCTNSLKFLEDISIPDGTVVTAGQAIDKQWRVRNDGSCDWGSGYFLKLVSGDPMGTPAEIALYPALSGAEAIIDIPLTTPQAAGNYHTVWQASAPDGTAFDQPIYVDLVVQ